ncbi:hypothetical protein [Syntrophomonas palmitatica]|uniref:hypothetical protein n=1 Tax=Syntrophomonas palmitatica TaxID=402877 RepID=UPI0012ED5C31|nr:hypothetical protein [Syntrophomonas palmitatica]
MFYTAQTIGDKGSDALKKGQLNQAERLFARAARLDRSEARYPLNLALINSVYFREKGDRTYYTEALSYAALAQSLDPYNLENNAMLLRAYKLLQRTDLQLKHARE